MHLPLSLTAQPTNSPSSPSPPDADPSRDLDLRASLASLVHARWAALEGYDDGGTERTPQPWPDWPAFPVPEQGDAGGGIGGGGETAPMPGHGDARHGNDDQTLAILIPLLILLTTLLFLLFLLTLLLLRRKFGRGIALPTNGAGAEGEVGGPVNLADENALFRDAEGGFEGVESRWLEEQDEVTKVGYARAKAWQLSYPPNSQPSEITLSQFLSIQEKGVSAWSFEPDYESNPSVVVVQRTEITFLDSTAADEPCSVLSNLPVPKLNETYYWECKMFELPAGTGVSVGFATRPYPSFRLPGHSPHSLAYHSPDGFLSASHPFLSRSYGSPLAEGDTLGIGYRPRTGTVFYTRNGRSLGDAFVGFNKFNVFPCVGATGPATVHVNLGQAGFVFIEANVKKWGLAPMMGTLAPPPAYGSERGSILLEAAARDAAAASSAAGTGHSHHLATASSSSVPSASRSRPTPLPSSSTRHRTSSSTASAAAAAAALGSVPIRPSPLRHSRSLSSTANSSSTATPTRTPEPPAGAEGQGVAEEEEDEEAQSPHNPPTPGLLDISLHSMHQFPTRLDDDDDDSDEEGGGDEVRDEEEQENEGAEGGEEQRLLTEGAGDGRQGAARNGAPSPPPPEYNPIDPHMYAPGVAETILEDALSAFSHAPSSSQPNGSSSSRPSSASPSSAASRLPPLNPAQAALLQRFVQERAQAAQAAQNQQGGAGQGGATGGFWGWLSGRNAPAAGQGSAV
ncbi:hypothetical protein JCM11251_005763 [Rhodosporidiobolus azoricus]